MFISILTRKKNKINNLILIIFVYFNYYYLKLIKFELKFYQFLTFYFKIFGYLSEFEKKNIKIILIEEH